MNDVIIACRNVSKSYAQADAAIEILRDISFEIKAGETVAIIGSSGAGKSTLLNLLGGLDDCSAGDVSIAGQSLAVMREHDLSQLRNQKLGFVYQAHHLLNEFDAQENAAMPLLIRGMNKKEALKQAQAMLDQVGLQHRYSHRPQSLSGGERQRVAIARALVAKPACVLMDEPTGNLDEHTADNIQNLLERLNQQLNISFVIVTHDKKIALRQQRILSLSEGVLTEVTGASIA